MESALTEHLQEAAVDAALTANYIHVRQLLVKIKEEAIYTS